MRIKETELERIIYDRALAQFQTAPKQKDILPSDGLDARMEKCLAREGGLYECFVAQKLGLEGYRVQKDGVDKELNRLRRALAVAKERTEQTWAAHDQAGLLSRLYEAGSLTIELADELIDRVEIYPEGKVELAVK